MPPTKKAEPTVTAQCHAYNRQLQRCEKHANHVLSVDDEAMRLHGFSVTWDEDECWTPEMAGALDLGGLGQVLTQQPEREILVPDDDDTPVPNGPCFICQCPEAAHRYLDEDGDMIDQCERHGCKTYMP